MRLKLAAGMLIVAAGGAHAGDCSTLQQVYHSKKDLPAAQAYIACFEQVGFGVVASLPGSSAPITTPSFWGPAPGNPNTMPIDQYLRQLKETGGYSDFEWSQALAGTLPDGSVAVVYDKVKLAPQFRTIKPFEIPASGAYKADQYFVDESTFNDLSQFALEEAIE